MSDLCDVVMPALVAALRTEADSEVAERVAHGLDNCMEHMQEEALAMYLPDVMPPLLHLIAHSDSRMHDTLLSCLSSAAAAGGEGFEPFVGVCCCALCHKCFALSTAAHSAHSTCAQCLQRAPANSTCARCHQCTCRSAAPVVEQLQRFMALTAPNALPARTAATECVGLVAETLGRSVAEELLPPFLHAAAAGFQLEAPMLREYGHGLFAVSARVLQSSFTPFLHGAFDLAKASIQAVRSCWTLIFCLALSCLPLTLLRKVSCTPGGSLRRCTAENALRSQLCVLAFFTGAPTTHDPEARAGAQLTTLKQGLAHNSVLCTGASTCWSPSWFLHQSWLG
jgi:hypothetical protein